MSIKWILIISFVFINKIIFAQTCCTGGVPYLGALKLPIVQKHEFGVNLSYNFNQNNLLVLDNEVINNSQNYRQIQTAILQTDFGISDHVSISLILPFLFQVEQIETENYNRSIQNNGFGDISIGSNYKGKFGRHNLNLGLGLKIPTGKTDSRDPETDVIFPVSFQNGTGSWDILFNVYDDFSLSNRNIFFWVNQLSGKINSKGEQFSAHPGYKFGHTFQYLTALSVRWVMGYSLADSFIGFSYQYISQDQFEGGFTNNNTGGNWIYTNIGYNHQLNPKLNFGLSGSVPIYRSVNGLQLTTAWRANATISYIL